MNEGFKGIRLITRADDAGSGTSADRAIVEAIERGIVRNVSLMAVGPSIDHAAELLARRKDVCFGLHATLNAEWSEVRWGPLMDANAVPSLVEPESSLFTRSPRDFLDKAPSIEEIMNELQAQLDRLRRLGFDIRYADTHMVFEWAVPDIVDPFDYWCEREGILSYRKYNRRLPDAPSPNVEQAEDGMAQELIARLNAAPDGQYLVVGHPGYDDEEMRRLGSPDYPSERVVADRVRERLMFTHPEVLACCRQLGVQPVRFDEAELP